MNARRWLDELRTELTRRRLPLDYIERMTCELSDHFHLLLEDRMSTDAKDLRSVGARLGQARDIATAAADEFRRRHFSGRHPVLMFLLLPMATLPLLWAALLVVLLLVAKALGLESGGANLDGPVAATMTAWMPTILFVVLLLPVIAAAACMCRLAMRTGVNRKWMVLACSLVAILGGAAVVNVALPTTTAKGA